MSFLVNEVNLLSKECGFSDLSGLPHHVARRHGSARLCSIVLDCVPVSILSLADFRLPLAGWLAVGFHAEGRSGVSRFESTPQSHNHTKNMFQAGDFGR